MLTPNWYPSSRELRQFAVAALVALTLLGLSIWRATGSVRSLLIAMAIGAVTFLIGMVAPAVLRSPYALLMALTLPIGWLVSHLLLLVIYYGFITPVGWVFRLFGRDALQLRRSQVESYWQPYPTRKGVGSYFRQA